MKVKLCIFSIIFLMSGIVIGCNDSGPDYDNFSELTATEQENIVGTTGSMLSVGLNTVMADMQTTLQGEMPLGGGGGGVNFSVNANYGCDLTYPAMDFECTGGGTVEGPAGGTATYSGEITGSVGEQDVTISALLDFSFNKFAQEDQAGIWSITGDLSAEGSGVVNYLTGAPSSLDLNFAGNIDTNTPYGIYNCDINVDYSISGSTATLSGTWCGYSVSQEFPYYTAY